MTFDQARMEFLKGYFSTNERENKTKMAYYSDLIQFQLFVGKDFTLMSMKDTLIEDWAAYLKQKKYSSATIRRKMVILRVFCSYWVRKGVLLESPFWRLRLSFGRVEELPRILTESEITALLAKARGNYLKVKVNNVASEVNQNNSKNTLHSNYITLRNLAIIDLLFATGMRVGEVSSLDVQDFVGEEFAFKVYGKGGKERLAFIVDKEVLKFQQEYLKIRTEFESSDKALFLNVFGKRLSTQGIANIVAQLCNQAGISRHVTPHMLRHTVATLLLRNGVDIRVIQEFLGHSSIATTQRYTHVAKEHMINILRKFHPSLALRATTI
jgi:integrase/recombinase XerD